MCHCYFDFCPPTGISPSLLKDILDKAGLYYRDEEVVQKCIYVSVVACGCVATPVFMIGVTLLGWSSFEHDTMQLNG